MQYPPHNPVFGKIIHTGEKLMPSKETKVDVGEENKKVVDISDFFTKDRKEQGVWHEPVVDGRGIGIEFKIIGSDSDAAAPIFSDYDKDMTRIGAIEDTSIKMKEIRDVDCKTGSKLVKDLRAKNGFDAKIDGKPLVYSTETVYRIFFNAPSIARDIIDFAKSDGNFMVRK